MTRNLLYANLIDGHIAHMMAGEDCHWAGRYEAAVLHFESAENVLAMARWLASGVNIYL